MLGTLLLLLLSVAAASGLVGQFVTTVMLFERVALAVERRLFGMRLSRRWCGADQVHDLHFQWFGKGSRLTFCVARNALIQVAYDVDESQIRGLLATLREPNFSYAAGSEIVDEVDPREAVD